MLGSMLFLRCVSGSRVITGVDVKDVHGHKFEGMIWLDFSDVSIKHDFCCAGWGSHHSSYPVPYLTAAAAIGMRRQDVELFVHRLDKALGKLKGMILTRSTVVNIFKVFYQCFSKTKSMNNLF